MTGFWSPGNIWRGGILLPINCNHRALMNDAALYQRLRRAPLISMWGEKKNLLISGSEDMRAVFIRYYNGTLTQICGFSWEEVQSHLAWRMPLHVAHIFISHIHWVKVGHWHGWYMARPPPTPTPPLSWHSGLLIWILSGARRCRELARWSLIKPLIDLWCRQEQHCKQTNQGRFRWWSSGGTTGDSSTTWFLRYFRFQTDFHVMASRFQNLFPAGWGHSSL